MSTTVYDAREALIPGSVYDRSGNHPGQMFPRPTLDMFARTHDPIGYISPERAQAAMTNVPVPVGLLMNMAHIPPRFYNQQQQAMQTRDSSRMNGNLSQG